MSKVKVIVQNVDSKIVGFIHDDVKKKIIENLTYKTSEFNGVESVEIEHYLFKKKYQTFPTGMFRFVADALDGFNIEFDVEDQRKKPTDTQPIELLATLRDYQDKVVNEAIENQRFVIQVATGGGKTVIASAIIAKLNVPTLFIVHTGDLFKQAYDELSKFLGVPIGRIGGGYCEVEKINVCMIQTIHAVIGEKYIPFDEIEKELEETDDIVQKSKLLTKPEKVLACLENTKCILIDESHHISSSSYINMMKVCKNAFYRGGLSATPKRGDGRDMILTAYAGSIIGNISASYLIRNGWLVKPTIYFLNGNNFSNFKYSKKKYNSIYKKFIIENKYRNELIIESAKRMFDMDMTVLITVATKKHGQLLLSMISEKYPEMKSQFIFSGVKAEKRKLVLDQMRSRDLNVLIGTSLADEGLDIPSLDGLILAGAGKSATRMIQRIGRVLRKPKDRKKERAIVVDFKDNVRYLLSHYRKRKEIISEEPEFEIVHA